MEWAAMVVVAAIVCAVLGAAAAFAPPDAIARSPRFGMALATRKLAPPGTRNRDRGRCPHLRSSPTAAIDRSSSSAAPPRLSPSDLRELADEGYVVVRDFLPPDLVSALRRDVSALRSRSKFRAARIGQDSTNEMNTDVRVAETCFLGRNRLGGCPDDARERLYDALDGVREDLSGNIMFGEGDKAAPVLDGALSELLYAYYPRGGYYRRHCDSVTGSASVLREYSLLLYLNEGWTKEDGGELRMHMDSGGDFLPPGEEPNFLDVEPRGGTLVLFRSDRVPHEVLDTRAERAAVVGWYNRPVTSADVANLASDEDRVRAGMLLVAAALVTGGLVSLLT